MLIRAPREVGFEVHLWDYTMRDHYVSVPVTVCRR